MKGSDKKKQKKTHDGSLMIQLPQRVNSKTCDVISVKIDTCLREFATLRMQGSVDS